MESESHTIQKKSSEDKWMDKMGKEVGIISE